MEQVSEILLVVGVLGAAVYCYVLGQRLKKFSNLKEGMGSAIAVLSTQVTEMTTVLDEAKQNARGSVSRLEATTKRAEAVAKVLEMHIASMHDLPRGEVNSQKADATTSEVKIPAFVRGGSRREVSQ